MPLKILFVYPLSQPRREVYHGYHHGIGQLSAQLKARGHETSLLATHSCDPETVEKTLQQVQPDLIAITSTTTEFPLAKKIAGQILQQKELPLFFGGVHATIAPEDILAIKGARGLCRGDGEHGFVQVVDSLEKGPLKTDIPGFWFRQGDQWIKNPPAAPAVLTDLAFPDREIFDFGEWVKPVHKIIGAEFLGSRGCPFHCSYCSAPFYNDLYKPHAYWRKRPVEDLLAEIKNVLAQYPWIKTIGFHDDIFTLDKDWLAEFCNSYPKVIGRPFWFNTRVGCITEEEAKRLRQAGCIRVHMAIETGNARLREKILKRRIADEEIIEAFAFLKKAGLKRLAFNMLGLPFETEETIKQTIALNRKIRPDWLHVTMFQPFPGTDLFELCKEKGLLADRLSTSYYETATALKNPDLPEEVLFRYLREFVSLVYRKEK